MQRCIPSPNRLLCSVVLNHIPKTHTQCPNIWVSVDPFIEPSVSLLASGGRMQRDRALVSIEQLHPGSPGVRYLHSMLCEHHTL